MKPPPLSSRGTSRLSEDWLAVIIGFALILLAVIGILGSTGLNVSF